MQHPSNSSTLLDHAQTALMAELSERAFEEITVKDICERAMVHRTTFYKQLRRQRGPAQAGPTANV